MKSKLRLCAEDAKFTVYSTAEQEFDLLKMSLTTLLSITKDQVQRKLSLNSLWQFLSEFHSPGKK